MGIEKQIVFVLDNISEYQQLIGDVPPSEVFVLDSRGDVLSQMATILAGYSNLDAIHLFSHGSSGSLDFGTLKLDSANLNDYAAVLSDIGASLNDNGDILLYGCNVAEGQNGVGFISKLSQATETDIAASDDVTGASDKGGDWILESSSGNIEAHSMTIGGFSGLLSNQPPVFTDATAPISANLGSNTASLNTQVMDMSIALATDGTPYAASMYYNDKLTVTKLTDGTWTVVGTADFTPGNAQDVHMVLDGNNTPYVLFQDMSNSGKSTVMKFDGESWVQVGSAISSGQTYQHFLDVDNDGNVYVEYALSNTVYVKEFDGSNWVSVGSSIEAAGSYSHFAIAQDNTPYLAYCDGAQNVIVDKWDSSAWVQVGAAAAAFHGAAPYLTFDGNDKPIIGYLDSTDNYALHVSEFDGANWNALGGTISGNYQGSIASISVDAQGNIYAGYKNASGNLAVALWNGTSWNELWTGPGFDGMGNQKATLLTGHDGNVFFGYPDNLGTNYAIVSNVALPILSLNVDENLTTIGTINVTDPENDSITLSISGGPDASAFTLNGTTLEFNTAADYEVPTDMGQDNIYSVELTATDAQNNTTTVLAMVQVNDVLEGGGGGNSTPENTISASYSTNEDVKKHINDLAVADADDDTLTVTLSIDNGVINLPGINTADGITGLDSDGLDGSVSFTGSVDDINTMLSEDGVDFYSLPNENGSPYATLTMTTSDGTETDIDTATINVSAVGDAPTFLQGGSYYDSDEDYTFDTKDSILQPDGKLVFTVIKTSWDASESYLEVIRLNADGTPDDTFGDEGVAEFEDWYFADSIALQPDGKIIVVGMDTDDNIYLARLNDNGSLGISINVSDETDLSDLFMSKALIQPDGKIVLVGVQNTNVGDGGDTVLIRYNSDGTLDTDFGTDGVVVQDYGETSPNGAEDAVLLANGKIIVAGAMDDENGTLMAVACFDTDGSLDTTFGTNGIATLSFGAATSISEANAIAIDANGKIVIAGYTDATDDGDLDVALARFNADGTVDNTTFGTSGKAILTSIHDVDFSELDEDAINGDDQANDITIDASGNIYVASSFNYQGDARYDEDIDANYTAIAKYDSNGVLDTTFGADGILIPEYIMEGYMDDGDDAALTSMIVQPDGNIVNVGWDYDDQWGGSFFAERIDSDGNQDLQFNANRDTVSYARTYSYEEGSLDYVTIGGRGNPPVVFDVEQHAEDNYSGGELTISRDGGANAEDIIRLDSTGLADADITLVGTSATTGNIKYSDSTIATFNHTTDGQLKIIFGAGSTQALVDAITANISYRNTNTLNPGGEDGYVELAWNYKDDFFAPHADSTCRIYIEGEDDGGITGTVSVSGTPTTLTITGLDSITDPDLVTDENPDGTVPEDDLSYQWQVSHDGGETWENIDGAWDATFEVTEAENGQSIRVVVGYEDRTNGSYTELESSESGQSGGGSSGGGSSTPSTPTTIINDDNLDGLQVTAPTTTTVGGATVTTQTGTGTRTYVDDEGHTITQTNKTVEAVQISAPTTGSGSTTTSVPLYWGETTKTEWATTASVTAGVTLSSEGNRAPAATQTTQTAIDDLIYYIQTTVPSTDTTKSEMLGGGSSFLSALSHVETLVVNKVVLSTTTSTTSTAPAAVTLDGTANAVTTGGVTDTPKEALVIDASSLPEGSTVTLSNIEFGVLTGSNLNVVLSGNTAQTVFTGSGTQTLTTSAQNNSHLYAGGGNDLFHIIVAPISSLSAEAVTTLNSVSTADTFANIIDNKTALYAEEGDDTASTDGAGTQNVFVHGGSGEDSISYQGSLNDYTITQDEGITYVRANGSTTTDVLLNVETIEFADGTSYTVQNTAAQNEIASLYDQVLGRQAEVDGFQYWAHSYNAGESMGEIAVNFVRSSEYFNNTGNAWDSMNNDQRVEVFYSLMLGRASDAEGKAYWLDAIANGMSIQDVAQNFVVSAEMQGNYIAQNEWNFIA